MKYLLLVGEAFETDMYISSANWSAYPPFRGERHVPTQKFNNRNLRLERVEIKHSSPPIKVDNDDDT